MMAENSMRTKSFNVVSEIDCGIIAYRTGYLAMLSLLFLSLVAAIVTFNAR